jgi:cell division septum initiation protein DivIVA
MSEITVTLPLNEYERLKNENKELKERVSELEIAIRQGKEGDVIMLVQGHSLLQQMKPYHIDINNIKIEGNEEVCKSLRSLLDAQRHEAKRLEARLVHLEHEKKNRDLMNRKTWF